jgi:UDPglucose 6-dehydrogenase
MKISVIGLGKLGLCTAVCCARAGFETWGMDLKKDYVALIKNGEIPFYESELEENLLKYKENLHLTTDISEAVANSDISLLIVPTPSQEDGAFSNEYLINALKSMGPALAAKKTFHVVDIVSTVMPGSCDNIFKPLLEKITGKKVAEEIGLAYNPEFIAIGSVLKNFLNPDLLLIGESDPQTGQALEEMYSAVCDNNPHVGRTSLINAEIAKLSINCYCTMKISFANNLASICEKVAGADAGDITEIIGHDSRIGGKYILPGLGFGGPCFPRDNEAFINFTRQAGGFSGLQQAVVDINNAQPGIVTDKIISLSPENGTVALLGQAYKPQTYLTERSQALEIALKLSEHRGLKVKVYDPLAKEHGPWETCQSLAECVTGANVAAILTPWPEFFDTSWHRLLCSGATILNLWK